MTKTSIKKQMIIGKFVIKNDRGLHTRPSTELVKCASMFKSKILLYYRRHVANAKSLLGILMLAAEKGAKIKIEAEGEDAEQAVQSIIELAAHNFYIKY
ncbi:MAG: HPr family phosphocarrier protein [Parachlamydiaceae bacterium]|nr:HPr family phosphocarrier protein [Parachlamydiaceae bacterium]